MKHSILVSSATNFSQYIKPTINLSKNTSNTDILNPAFQLDQIIDPLHDTSSHAGPIQSNWRSVK